MKSQTLNLLNHPSAPNVYFLNVNNCTEHKIQKEIKGYGVNYNLVLRGEKLGVGPSSPNPGQVVAVLLVRRIHAIETLDLIGLMDPAHKRSNILP